MNITLIPSDHYASAKQLNSDGFNYTDLKNASKTGGGIDSMDKQKNKTCLLQVQEL